MSQHIRIQCSENSTNKEIVWFSLCQAAQKQLSILHSYMKQKNRILILLYNSSYKNKIDLMLFFYEEEMQNKAEVNLKNKAKQKTNKMNSLVKFELVILGGIPLFLSFCLQQEKHNIYIFHEKGIN